MPGDQHPVAPVLGMGADAVNVVGDVALHAFGAGVRIGFELGGYDRHVAKGAGGLAGNMVDGALIFVGVGQLRQGAKAYRALQKAGRAAGGLEMGAAGRHLAQHGRHAGEIVEHAGKAFPHGAIKLNGRAGKQKQLKHLMEDNKLGNRDRGWLKQEYNAVQNKKRKAMRVPLGKHLAHKRGQEAAKGFDYGHAHLQDVDLHKLQHKYDANGIKNKKKKDGGPDDIK